MNKIKNPTTRKVRNRGFVPLRYRSPDGVVHGWIVKEGRKWVHFFSVTDQRTLKLELTEQRYMKEV